MKFTYKEQKEYETIDDEIASLEQKIEELDEQMMQYATNSAKLRKSPNRKKLQKLHWKRRWSGGYI